MNKVKWTDADGGWHTGEVVPNPDGGPTWWMESVLVKESCDGKLTWVPLVDLSEWESREKWEGKDE